MDCTVELDSLTEHRGNNVSEVLQENSAEEGKLRRMQLMNLYPEGYPSTPFSAKCRHPVIKKKLSRPMFDKLRNFIHLDDNSKMKSRDSPKYDKLFKIVEAAFPLPVSTSMKNKTYDIEMHTDKEDGIVKGICACPRGLVSCHHMAALCIYARDNVSVTDPQCSCNIPIPGKDDKPLEDLYPSRRADYLACRTELSDTVVEEFRESFSNFDNVIGCTWLWNAEPADISLDILRPIEDILHSDEYIYSGQKMKTFMEMAKLSDKEVNSAMDMTIGQSGNTN
ncbi:hypothetical protein QE152_g34319 [Popillia japonica]|uniref:SWIM-type domain-containing protein n=1 Tax=Popillia japonica TaxID=7064 RepID=A0AAW1ITE7_POPJA